VKTVIKWFHGVSHGDTMIEEKDLSFFIFKKNFTRITKIWGKSKSTAMRGLEQRDYDVIKTSLDSPENETMDARLEDYVTGVVFDNYINQGVEFQVYGVKKYLKSPVIKILREVAGDVKGTERIKHLRERIYFVRKNMGGIIAPFDVLTDVDLSYVEPESKAVKKTHQSIVIVQRRMTRISSKNYQRFISKIIDLFERLCGRGIRYSEKLGFSNMGYDPKEDKVYLVDIGNPRFEQQDKMINSVKGYMKNSLE